MRFIVPKEMDDSDGEVAVGTGYGFGSNDDP